MFQNQKAKVRSHPSKLRINTLYQSRIFSYLGLVVKHFNMATARAKSRKRKLKDVEVPFAVGFHPPTPKQSINAIGISPLPIHFEPGPENAFFQMISQPCSIDDWLAQYKEEGQSYKNFLRICPWISGRKVKYMKQKFVSDGKNIKERYPDGKIYLQPLGEFDSDSSPSVDDLRSYAKRFYSLSVVILPPVKLKLPTKKGWLLRGSGLCRVGGELNQSPKKSLSI